MISDKTADRLLETMLKKKDSKQMVEFFVSLSEAEQRAVADAITRSLQSFIESFRSVLDTAISRIAEEDEEEEDE